MEPYEDVWTSDVSMYEKMTTIAKHNLRPKKLDDIPPELLALLQKAWHPDAEQRPTARGTFTLLLNVFVTTLADPVPLYNRILQQIQRAGRGL